MPERLLQLDDLRTLNTPDKIAAIFHRLGYNSQAEVLAVEELGLSAKNLEAINKVYLIANQENGALMILLFELNSPEWVSPTAASIRMKSIATQVGQRQTEFLLLATLDYNQLLLVNPRKSFDSKLNLTTSIRKLLIDRTNPTAYDLDRLEAIAVRNQSPQQLYQSHCAAFDVEKLTKSFYQGYKTLFDKVIKVVQECNPHPYFAHPDALHQFSQRLLGRVMFLYFLQKKGFLAADSRFLSTRYRVLQPEPEDTNYYTEVLEPLFFATLNQQRPNLSHSWGAGKIPYLNGGLFDRDYGVGVKDAVGRETPHTIILPNSLFDPGDPLSILGFFNGYNFTVAENVQGDEDVAVDPEMLGKVFENMLAAEERGQSGTFYTPRSIVNFMCSAVICGYLLGKTNLSEANLQRLLNYDEEMSEPELNQLLSPQQAKELDRVLATIKILDPAVGSGAFPLGMIQVILTIKQAVARRLGMLVQRGSLTISQWKREIIANNLYGVDLKPGAIEIAKLRLWLSLVVDIPHIDNVEPLPNLDYKLMCGDSLINTINGEQLIPLPQAQFQTMLAVTPIQNAIQPLLSLQQLYFTAQSEERSQLRQQILEAEANVFQAAVTDKRNFWLNKQRELEKDIQKFKKPSKQQEKKRQDIIEKIEQLDKLALQVAKREKSINFFQYYLHFRDVFESQGGFDVVIGNPPYVRQEQIKELKPALKDEYECYTGVADLYVYFYEQGLRLLKNNGLLSYISSNKYFRAGYGEKLRQFLGCNSKIELLIDFGDASVFEAIAYPSIILLRKTDPENNKTRVLTWESEKSVNELVSEVKNKSFMLEQKQLTPDGWRLESNQVLQLLAKLRNAGTPLGEYVNGRFYRGVLTGFNEAFVVDRETKDKLISEHPSSAAVLKPFLRGRDVKRWCVDFQDLWLIKIESSENKKHPWSDLPEKEAEKIFANTYPVIYARFQKYRDKLVKRCDQGKYFWELRSCAYYKEFEFPKIVWGNLASKPQFSYGKEGFYLCAPANLIVSEQNQYLIAILNSQISQYLVSQSAATRQGGFLEYKPMYISQIRIPSATEEEKEGIEKLVEKCLEAKGVGVEEWEAEIDERVARLYGLNEEEVRIIRDSI